MYLFVFQKKYWQWERWTFLNRKGTPDLITFLKVRDIFCFHFFKFLATYWHRTQQCRINASLDNKFLCENSRFPIPLQLKLLSLGGAVTWIRCWTLLVWEFLWLGLLLLEIQRRVTWREIRLFNDASISKTICVDTTAQMLLVFIASVETVLKVSKKALRYFVRQINDLRDIHWVQIMFLWNHWTH